MTKEDRINLRVSGPQRQAWEEAAQKADRTLADWIRVTIERICSGTDVPVPSDPEQRERWEQAASADRRTLTDWIRIQLDDAADRELGDRDKRSK